MPGLGTRLAVFGPGSNVSAVAQCSYPQLPNQKKKKSSLPQNEIEGVHTLPVPVQNIAE